MTMLSSLLNSSSWLEYWALARHQRTTQIPTATRRIRPTIDVTTAAMMTVVSANTCMTTYNGAQTIVVLTSEFIYFTLHYHNPSKLWDSFYKVQSKILYFLKAPLRKFDGMSMLFVRQFEHVDKTKLNIPATITYIPAITSRPGD